GSSPPEFFSSHPNPDNRQQAVQRQIANWPPQSFVGDSAEFDRLRQHATELKTYSAAEIANGAKSGEWAAMNQRHGATFHSTSAATTASPPIAVALQSVMPSSRMVNADLGPMKIQRPENWDV